MNVIVTHRCVSPPSASVMQIQYLVSHVSYTALCHKLKGGTFPPAKQQSGCFTHLPQNLVIEHIIETIMNHQSLTSAWNTFVCIQTKKGKKHYHLCSVEHRIERSNFIHTNRSNFNYLRHLYQLNRSHCENTQMKDLYENSKGFSNMVIIESKYKDGSMGL